MTLTNILLGVIILQLGSMYGLVKQLVMFAQLKLPGNGRK